MAFDGCRKELGVVQNATRKREGIYRIDLNSGEMILAIGTRKDKSNQPASSPSIEITTKKDIDDLLFFVTKFF